MQTRKVFMESLFRIWFSCEMESDAENMFYSLSFGSATITCFEGVAGSGISEERFSFLNPFWNCFKPHHKLLSILQSLLMNSLICICSCQNLQQINSLSSISCELWWKENICSTLSWLSNFKLTDTSFHCSRWCIFCSARPSLKRLHSNLLI